MRNETTKGMLQVEKNVIDEVQKRQLMWFGYTNIEWTGRDGEGK